MNEQSLGVFVDALTNYFNVVSTEPAKVSTPFLIQDINEYLFDFTGIISISGNYRGSVFFSAPRIMMAKLTSEISSPTTRDEKLLDLVGEVSNTLSGNARRQFGDQFMLTTPVTFLGKSQQMKVSDISSIFVVPVVWLGMKAHLIINLNEE